MELLVPNLFQQFTYGISYRSPLNEIDDFHVANGQLPQDIMHVLFEGVLPKEIKLMLNSFINEQQFFTLDTLNHVCVWKSRSKE